MTSEFFVLKIRAIIIAVSAWALLMISSDILWKWMRFVPKKELKSSAEIIAICAILIAGLAVSLKIIRIIAKRCNEPYCFMRKKIIRLAFMLRELHVYFGVLFITLLMLHGWVFQRYFLGDEINLRVITGWIGIGFAGLLLISGLWLRFNIANRMIRITHKIFVIAVILVALGHIFSKKLAGFFLI